MREGHFRPKPMGQGTGKRGSHKRKVNDGRKSWKLPPGVGTPEPTNLKKPNKPNKPTFPKAFPIARGRAPFQLHHIPGGGIVQATTAQHTPAKSSFTADSRPVPMVGCRRFWCKRNIVSWSDNASPGRDCSSRSSARTASDCGRRCITA